MKRTFRDILQTPEFQKRVACTIKTYRPGDMIVEEGSSSNEMFLILSGDTEVRAAVDHLGTPGRTTGIAKLSENAVVGELSSLFEHHPRTASVVATTDVEAAMLDSASLENFMDENPAEGYWILKEIFSQVVNRMRETNLRSAAITALYLNEIADA
ncbi:cyclic nucleotide-binding domain-containing protein [Methylomagnum sp.]